MNPIDNSVEGIISSIKYDLQTRSNNQQRLILIQQIKESLIEESEKQKKENHIKYYANTYRRTKLCNEINKIIKEINEQIELEEQNKCKCNII